MVNSSRNYGLSLYSLANEENITKLIYDELKFVSEIISDNGEYIRILDSAAISGEEKYSMINNAFSGKVHSYIVNFIKILAGKRLMYTFSDCCNIFEKQYRSDNNIETITVTTAIELTGEEKERLLSSLRQNTKKLLFRPLR